MPSSVVTHFPIPDAGVTVINNSTSTYTVASNEYVEITVAGTQGNPGVNVNGGTYWQPGSAGTMTARFRLDEGDTFAFAATSTTAGALIEEYNK